MEKRSIITFSQLFLAAALLIGAYGCQKSKKPVIRPGSGEVTQETYSAGIFGYKTSIAVKADPHELADYFLKDLFWVKQLMSAFQFKLSDPKAAMDLSKVGNSFDASGKILGINFPIKVVNIRYVPDKEAWLLFLSGDVWLLVRLEAKPFADGTMVSLNALGYISPGLSKVADSLQLQKTIVSRVDYAVATVQAKFDPSLDPKQLTEKGLRGESFEKFFQVYQASVWINASPDNVIKRGLAPETFREIIDAGQVKGLADCLFEPANRLKWDAKLAGAKAGEMIYCPDTSVKIMGVSLETDTFSVFKMNDLENFLSQYLVVAGSLIQMDMFGKPDKGGTLVTIRLMLEPPGSSSQNLTEAFIAISGVPQWIKSMLMDIKSRTESVG